MNLEKKILKVLAYFDIFHYPVTVNEIRSFLPSAPDHDDLLAALERLCLLKAIYSQDEFYSLHDDYSVILQRRNDNRRAEILLKTAYRISSFLFQFPYVRGIGISGSLSKNVADENADIDFFVITKSNRLWIARTLMHIFKKVTFLLHKEHWFCMNYYVDEDALQISDKNIYTATEVVTLVPVCGNGVLKSFFEANNWTRAYFPNYELCTDSKKKSKSSVLKKSIELILNNALGDRLDNYLMRLTSRRWSHKELEGKVNIRGGRMGLRTNKHFSKPNPAFFQQKVLLLYQDKLSEVDRILHTSAVN
jgi:hypothetical protein